VVTPVRRYLVQAIHRSMPHVISYWYGPRHGWGTTSGPLADSAVARFSRRAAAENALRSVFRHARRSEAARLPHRARPRQDVSPS
jgi:hypothetical protein